MAAKAVAGPDSSVAGGAPPKIRIAVAGGHPIFSEGLFKLLDVDEDLEFVAQADDGCQVLGMLHRSQPDILLLDLRMPGLDALAALQQLEMAQTNTRVIALTASDYQPEFIETLNRWTGRIVPKQATMETLISCIHHIRAGEIWLDQRTTTKAVAHRIVASPDASGPHESPSQDVSQLSPREREIVVLVRQGFKDEVIAEKLSIAEQTVTNYLHGIFDKLKVTDRLELALLAVSVGLHL